VGSLGSVEVGSILNDSPLGSIEGKDIGSKVGDNVSIALGCKLRHFEGLLVRPLVDIGFTDGVIDFKEFGCNKGDKVGPLEGIGVESIIDLLDGSALGSEPGSKEGHFVGLPIAALVCKCDGKNDGYSEGIRLGIFLGNSVGIIFGNKEEVSVGSKLGSVGIIDGNNIIAVGLVDGAAESVWDGYCDGSSEGVLTGIKVREMLGLVDGAAESVWDGYSDGS